MKFSMPSRFWLEAALASLCGLLALLTLFSRDWVEAITGFDPDQRDGSFEWIIVGALLLLCCLLSLAARSDWRNAKAALSTRS